MGFKNNKVKYFIVKEGYLDDKCECSNKIKKLELTPGQMLDLTYGLIPQDMFKVIIEGLKEESK